MKKIGIITLNGNFNYGNRLQNFALQEYLRSVDMNPVTLSVRNNSSDKILKKLKNVSSLSSLSYVLSKEMRKFSPVGILNRKKYKKMLNVKEKILAPFSRERIISLSITPKECKEIEKDYDLFIVGSDQVWNPNIIGFDTINFLQFTSKEKRNSYSASFGVSDIPDELSEHYRVNINEMNYISVREQAGANIIKKLANIEVDVAPDPTLLLSREKWISLIENESSPESNYIFLYFISDVSDEKMQEIEKYANRNKLKIIRVMGDKYDEGHIVINPLEFIKYISCARYVITDSFHCCVFSIIMHTPFYVYERTDNKGTSSRIETLLVTFGLEFALTPIRFIPEEHWEKVNYDSIDCILEKQRSKGQGFLDKLIK